MTTLPRTLNFGAIAAALAWTTLSVGALVSPAPAYAQSQNGFYTATLAKPADKRINVAGGIVWSCEGTACTGTKSTSRPVRACRDLNRELGDVVTFAAKGEALDEAMLARCNG